MNAFVNKSASIRIMEGELSQALEVKEHLRSVSLSRRGAFTDREWELMLQEMTQLRNFVLARQERLRIAYDREGIPPENRRYGSRQDLIPEKRCGLCEHFSQYVHNNDLFDPDFYFGECRYFLHTCASDERSCEHYLRREQNAQDKIGKDDDQDDA